MPLFAFRNSRLLPLIVASALPMLAQGVSTQLSGVVSSKDGSPVEGAAVQVRNAETGLTRVVRTDAKGRYLAPILPVGPYSVTVTKEGFQTASNLKVNLNLGDGAPLNVRLAGVASAIVEVTGTVTSVDTERAAAATFVSTEAMETLPTNGRRWENFALLTPQVTISSRGDIAIGGQRGVNTAVNVDGGNFNSSFFGGTLGSEAGGTPFTLSSEAIREFQVVTDGASAEFGGNGGGYLNAITKSGSNEFSGGAFFYERPQDLVATAHKDGKKVADFTNRQFGFSVGGPILKDKLFYFVSVDLQRDSRPINVTYGASASSPLIGSLNPAVPADKALLDNSTPYSWKNNQDAIFVRLDWMINTDHALQFRINRSSFTGDNNTGYNAAYSATSLEEGKTLSLVGQWNWNISANWLNEFRVNSVTEELPRTPRGTKPQVSTRNVGMYGMALYGRKFESKQIQISDTLTYVTPEWQVRGGVQYIAYDIFETFAPMAGGSYYFTSLANYRAGNWDNYKQFFSLQPGVSVEQAGTMDEKAKDLGAFIQAEWRPNRSFKLGLGLRYDRQEHPDFGIADFNASNFASYTRPGPLTARIPTDSSISPRFSFTWTPQVDQDRTVVRGSAGLYVSRTPSVFNYQVLTSNGQRAATIEFRAANLAAYPLFTRGGTFNYSDPFRFDSYDAANFPAAAAPAIQSFDPNFKNPRTTRINLGAERAMGMGLTLGLSATYAKTQNLERITDVNLQLLGYNSVGRPVYNNNKGLEILASYLPNDPLVLIRPNGNYASMQLYTSDAEAKYQALTVSAKYAPEGSFIDAQLFYTYAKDKDSDSNERSFSGYYTQDPNRLEDDFSWSSNDRRNVVTGYVNVHERWFSGVRFGFNVRYLSGLAYSPVFGADLSADGNRNDRIWGTERNSYREPGRYIIDLKIGRDWTIAGRYKIGISADVFNLFNKATRYIKTTGLNGTDAAPTAPSTAPTTLDVVAGKIGTERQVQLGARFAF